MARMVLKIIPMVSNSGLNYKKYDNNYYINEKKGEVFCDFAFFFFFYFFVLTFFDVKCILSKVAEHDNNKS